MRVRRFDLGALEPAVRRPDGTLVAQARLTRTGVFTYRNADGTTRKEYRPPASVGDAKSLASFHGVPVTDDHPPMMLTASNARMFSVGAVMNDVHKDGDHVVATIAVHDAGTIKKMDEGKSFVSCGYDCELDETPGVAPSGEKYDAIQTNIVGNHLAITDNPRAGATAAVRMDGASMRVDEEKPATPPGMTDIKVGTGEMGDYGGQPPAVATLTSLRGEGPKNDPDDGEEDEDAYDTMMEYEDSISAEQRENLGAHQFAYPEEKKLPIDTTKRVRAAMSYFTSTDFSKDPAAKGRAAKRIAAAAKARGIDPSGFEEKHVDMKMKMDNVARVKSRATISQKEPKMLEQPRTDSDEVKELAAKAAKRKVERDAEKARADALEETCQKLQAKLDDATSQLSKAKRERQDALDATPARVRARVALEQSAAKVLRTDEGEPIFDAKSDRDIKLAVIKHVTDADCTDKPDAYVDARYDAALERADAAGETHRKAGELIASARLDGAASNMDAEVKKTIKARNDMIDRNRNMWREPFDKAQTKMIQVSEHGHVKE